MANVKITELTAATALAGTDVLPIVDVGADATKKVSVSDLLRNLPDGSAASPSLAFADDQNTGVLSPAANELAFATSGTQRLVIDSSGRVGIGTLSPGNTFHLKGAQGVGIRFENSTSTNSSYLTIESGDKYQFNVGGSGYYTWVTGGSEKVRIDSSGRLLLGTTSDTAPGVFNAKIQTASTSFDGSISLRRDSNDAGSQSLVFGKSRGSLNGNTIVQSGDALGTITFFGADGTDLNTAAAQILAQVDGTPGSNDMPGRLVFSTSADGASSVTERMRITSTGQMRLAGAGITFNGDTAQANELDDYEEGTFTPSFGNLSGFDYSARTGRYVKIGKVVTVYILLSTINAASISNSGAVTITGLPFGAENNNNAGTPMLVLTHDNRFTNNPNYGQIQGGSDTTIVLFKDKNMNSAAHMGAADFTATNVGNYNLLSVNFTYEVD